MERHADLAKQKSPSHKFESEEAVTVKHYYEYFGILPVEMLHDASDSFRFS